MRSNLLEKKKRNYTKMETSLAMRVFVFNSEKRKRIIKILSTITQSTMKTEASLEKVANVSRIKNE